MAIRIDYINIVDQFSLENPKEGRRGHVKQ
jgi:hypothetical protein